MARLGEYIQEFAELLGEDNMPVFKGIKRASTGLKAYVPVERQHHAMARVVEAKQAPGSRPAKVLRGIEHMLGQDGIASAQILDASECVIHVLHGLREEPKTNDRLKQRGQVDGVVTGLVGADDTMHLHVRDVFDRDLKIVIRDENLARDVLAEFRKGLIRLHVDGIWQRSEDGWAPEANRCNLLSFERLEDDSPAEVLQKISTMSGNGWSEMQDPIATWSDLRGLH